MCEGTETSVPAGEEDPEPTQDASEETPKKKKKKKKVKEEEIEEEIPTISACQLDNGVTPEQNGMRDEVNGNEAAENKKKKKKKKEKRIKEEEEEMDVSQVAVHGSDSNGYISDKPSKKRKRESGNDVTSSFSEDPDPVKPKKKRKVKIEQHA